MKSFINILIFCTFVLTSLQFNYSNNTFAKGSINMNKNSTPLIFTENQGQWDDNVKFRANASGATMWFALDGVYYQFTRTIESKNSISKSHIEIQNILPSDIAEIDVDSVEIMMIKANFVGANTNPQMVGVDMIDYKCNYFIGNDNSKWTTNVLNYFAVLYKDIYEGIDLKYYGNGKQTEYDFIVSPNADFSQIKIQYEGVESVVANRDGELVIKTKWGEIVEQHPMIYQIKNDIQIQIEGKYILEADNTFSFKLSNYKKSLPLVIDLILDYSTCLGSINSDNSFGLVLDNSDGVYIIGSTFSSNFPIINSLTGTYQGGEYDCFVSKFSSSDNSLVYSTFFGGTGKDHGEKITLDSSGNIYLTGMTNSLNFPVINSYQGTYQGGDWDGFVSKLSGSGDSLIYSTYLGGSGFDWSVDIAVDDSGAAYLTGRTYSADFPTLNPIQDTHHDSSDVFVTKLNSAGDNIIYSTFLGGSNHDYGYGIAIDSSKNAYVIGYTSSINFPLFNSFQNSYKGNNDVFVSKLNSKGDSLIYSTYLGGSNWEYGRDILVDESGIALVIGVTTSSDFPTSNAYQSEHHGGSDVFITKLNSSGDSLKFSTYFGGSNDEGGYAITQDDSGAIYVTGMVSNNGFPTVNPYQDSLGGYTDAFLSKFTNSCTNLVYSTYFGGNHFDWGLGIAVDGSGSAYVTGRTKSSDFPTYNAFQSGNAGDYDAFLFKFSDISTDIEEFDFDVLPSDFNLSQNYPNPFNPTTTIEFNLPTKSNVNIKIYNLLGQEVQQLVNKEYSAGNYKVTWVGTSSRGIQTSTGIYFYRLETNSFVETKKMLLLK